MICVYIYIYEYEIRPWLTKHRPDKHEWPRFARSASDRCWQFLSEVQWFQPETGQILSPKEILIGHKYIKKQ